MNTQHGFTQSLKFALGVCGSAVRKTLVSNMFAWIRYAHPAPRKTIRFSARANTSAGFTLLLAVLIMTVVSSIGLSIMGIALRELQLSGTGRESELAFYAADAGMECALYWDTRTNSSFSYSAPAATVNCIGTNRTISPRPTTGNPRERAFEINWTAVDSEGNNVPLCARVTVTKSMGVNLDGRTCAAGRECTKIESRGYNFGCGSITPNNPRVVERALRSYR